ncbi:tetratricopeptide repeat protein, partial [candidate division KSB1 bacterium]|nr:tetratricopeptide repeat protein [candidate division KSB1 bacterium]
MKSNLLFKAKFLTFVYLLLTSIALFGQGSENTDFLYAKRLYDDKMYELAARQFRDFVTNYANSSRAPEALFMAGEAYFKAQLYEQARQSFLELSVRYSGAVKNDEAQLRIGDCYKALLKYQEAAEAYQRLKVFFPSSTFAPTGLI